MAQDKEQNYEFLMKVVIVGDTNVGKSALLLRWIDGVFTEGVKTVNINSDYKDKVVQDSKGTLVKVQVWDTVGQEKFRSITSSFYRSAHGVILTYDVTEKSSFDRVGDWFRDIKKNCQDATYVILVANKMDLIQSTTRAVSEEEGRAKGKELGIDYYEVSSKDNQGVDEAFKHLIDKIVEIRR